jgi:hypothetical protein
MIFHPETSPQRSDYGWAKGYSGRRKLPGQVYRLELYYRYHHNIDPPQVQIVLDLIREHHGAARRAILEALLVAGAEAAQRAAWQFQDNSETERLIDDMIADF